MRNRSCQPWCALGLPPKTNLKCLQSVARYKATSSGDDDDDGDDDNNNNVIEQLLVVGFCVGSLNHTKPVQWREKQAITAVVDAHLNLPRCLEGQKDAKEGDCGQGSEAKSRTSRECCELVQSLDHSSKMSCLTERSLNSLRFPLPSDLVEQSFIAQAACLSTAMNSCSLPSSASPFWGTTVSSGSMVATEQLSSI